MCVFKYHQVLLVFPIFIHTLKDYVKQYHSRTLNEFVIHLLHEGSEPQHFWDLFTFSSTLQPPSFADVMKGNQRRSYKDESEDEHEEINMLISDINSMVVNLSTSSVPNINELEMDSSKATLPLHDRFKLIKDSPLSQSCKADLQFAGIDRVNAATLKPSTKQEATEAKETQPKRKKWSLKVDPTTYQWLTIPAGMDLHYTLKISQIYSVVHHSEVVQKRGKNKKKTKGYMVTYI